jgi:aryl-alcohol dehydrogenase
MSHDVQAAVIDKLGGRFEVRDLSLADPGPAEVLVKVDAVGICHSDLAARDGHLPAALPAVLGHEGTGVVVAAGQGVSRVSPGDRVVLTFNSCGTCVTCASGHPAHCAEFLMRNFSPTRADGSLSYRDGSEAVNGHFFGQSSFSTLALADERCVVRVDGDVPAEVLAPLGCGVQTGAGAVLNVLQPWAGARVAVLGVGAVGLAAIMAARLTAATTIIAVDVVEARLELARELGATATINPANTDLAVALREHTAQRGVDCAVETTGKPEVFMAALTAMAPRGRVAALAVAPPGSVAPFEMTFLPMVNIVGVTEGDADPQTFIPALVDLYRQGRFPVDRLVETYKFADIEQAAQDMQAARTIKPVIVFE